MPARGDAQTGRDKQTTKERKPDEGKWRCVVCYEVNEEDESYCKREYCWRTRKDKKGMKKGFLQSKESVEEEKNKKRLEYMRMWSDPNPLDDWNDPSWKLWMVNTGRDMQAKTHF